MANGDSDRIVAAREALDKAMNEFAAAVCEQYPDWGVNDVPIVMAWTGVMEYTSTTLEQQDRSGCLRVTPDGQLRATTIGLLEDGKSQLLEAWSHGG